MLWGVVDTLVGSAEAVTEEKEREKKTSDCSAWP